jgi:hypothetical protein
MTARRGRRGLDAAFADGPIQRLLADTQQARGFPRADEVCAPGSSVEPAFERLVIFGQKAVVAAWGYHGGPDESLGHGA